MLSEASMQELKKAASEREVSLNVLVNTAVAPLAGREEGDQAQGIAAPARTGKASPHFRRESKLGLPPRQMQTAPQKRRRPP